MNVAWSVALALPAVLSSEAVGELGPRVLPGSGGGLAPSGGAVTCWLEQQSSGLDLSFGRFKNQKNINVAVLQQCFL